MGMIHDTTTVEIGKENNKIIQEDLYKKVKLTVHKGATILVDDKKISIEPKEKTQEDGEVVEVYSFIILADVKYDLGITHSIFEYEIDEMNENVDYTEYTNYKFKDDFSEKLKADISKICDEIITVAKTNGDVEDLNKYFINNDANKLIEENEYLNGSIKPDDEDLNYEFNKVLDTIIEQQIYIADNQLLLGTRTMYQDIVTAKDEGHMIIGDGGFVDSYEQGFDIELKLYWVLEGDEWKISHWE